MRSMRDTQVAADESSFGKTIWSRSLSLGRTVVVGIIRWMIYAFLVVQGVVSFLLSSTSLMGHGLLAPPSPSPLWFDLLSYGIVAASSFALFIGFLRRAIQGRFRYVYWAFALVSVAVSANEIVLIHQVGNTSWGAHVLYGFPLPWNLAILAVILIRPLYTFIFGQVKRQG
ncbi:MAG: hypothetical protein AB7D57_11230 [Desulfovibrionaceae bacterium]